MADSGGYWANLAEAQKLTQTYLVPGVIQENVRRGGLLDVMPLVQSPGKSTTWNRENAERTGKTLPIGGQLTWSDDITYTQKEVELQTIYDQTPLNNYVERIYGTVNNYEATVLMGLRKGAIKKLEDQLIYGDATYGTDEPDGLHAIGAEQSTTGGLNIDETGSTLSLSNFRVMEDAMKYGVDLILMPYIIARRIDAFYQEVASGGANTALGSFVWSPNEAGQRIPFWNGIPIQRSDILVAETVGTGEGSDAKAKNTTGSNEEFSIFFIKFGQVREGEPGLSLGFGGEQNQLGEVFRMERFEKLENYDASGLRVVGYSALMPGSSMAVGRIHGMIDGAVTA